MAATRSDMFEPNSTESEIECGCDHEDLDAWAARLPTPSPASGNVEATLVWLCDILKTLPIARLYPQLLARMIPALVLWPNKMEPKEWERCVRKGRIAKELNEVAPVPQMTCIQPLVQNAGNGQDFDACAGHRRC